MEECVQCLSEGGTMFAIEPTNMKEIKSLAQQLLERGIACKSIFLERLVTKPSNKKHLIERINQDLKLGVIVPLPLKVFKQNEIERAFRLISNEKSEQKILIQMPHLSDIKNMKIKPKFVAHSHSVYIITGGLGGLGLELANWLIMRGATILVLSSRKGVTTAYQQHRIK